MELSWTTLIKENYNILWKLIIRPPRAQYKVEDLGPPRFKMGDHQVYDREDLQLVNDRGHRLECSHFRKSNPTSKGIQEKSPCVIYLHGNCSCRLECADVVQTLLPRGFMVFSFDFSGSGLSEGEYISLGFFEELDLKVVIDHLRKRDDVGLIGVWGRSMGAATTVLRASKDPSIGACVLDSPFSSLRVVAEELVHSNSGVVTVPAFLLDAALEMVKGEVQTRAGFDIDTLQLVEYALKAESPALFAVATDDDFVLPHHTMRLYGAWGLNAANAGVESRKQHVQLSTFTGGHNGSRPRSFLEKAGDFLEERLFPFGKPTVVDLEGPSAILLPPPPQGPLASPPVAPVNRMRAGSPRSPRQPVSPSRAQARAPPRPRAELSDNCTMEIRRAKQLVSMGFSEDVALDAAIRHPTIEAAVEAIVKESMQILQESSEFLGRCTRRTRGEGFAAVMRRVEMRAPSLRRPSDDARGPAASRASEAAPQPNAAARADVAQQLRMLGFSEEQARNASTQRSSVEGAVDWLAENGEI